MKYEVLRDTFGFKNFFWNKGEIVDVEDGEKPSLNFKPLEPINLEKESEPKVSSEQTINLPAPKKRGAKKFYS
jgi:hypothetical protein